MKRQFGNEVTIILLALAVAGLGYVRIHDWMPELGLLGNLTTGDVTVLGAVEIKYHSILVVCALAICWAICLKILRARLERFSRQNMRLAQPPMGRR